MSKLLVFDSSNCFVRAYFGLKKQGLSTHLGLGTWGVYGTLYTLMIYIQRYQPTHVLIAQDGGRSAWRLQLDPDYKGNRRSYVVFKAEESDDQDVEEMFSQRTILTKFTSLLGIKSFREQGVEADDVIAWAVTSFKDQMEEVTIISADHDFHQLLDHNVIQVKPKIGSGPGKSKEVIYTREWALQEYGLEPFRIPELMALTGDSTDNIKGVKGVGPVNARKMIEKYGSLTNVLLYEKKVIPYTKEARLAYRLTQLDGSVVKPDLTLEDLEFNPVQPGDLLSSSIQKMFDDLEFAFMKRRWLDGRLWKSDDEFTMGRRLSGSPYGEDQELHETGEYL